jgi:hypothetical protein
VSAKLRQSTILCSPDCNLIEDHYHLTALLNHVSSTQTSYWRKQKKILDMGIWCGTNDSYIILRPPSMRPRHISCCASVDCHVPSSVVRTPGMATFGLYLFVEFDFMSCVVLQSVSIWVKWNQVPRHHPKVLTRAVDILSTRSSEC